jgi:hypothetical protein
MSDIVRLPRGTQPVQRLTISLPSDLADYARSVADEQKMPVSKVIGNSLALDKVVTGAVNEGAEILMKYPNGVVKQIKF